MRVLTGRSARARLALLSSALFLALGVGLLIMLVLLAKAAAPTVHATQSVAAPGLPRLVLHPNVIQLQRNADISRLVLIAVILVVLTALAAVPLGWFASGRMLRPLRDITARARPISA